MFIGRRVHLWEWEDLPWFPARIRDYLTDFLSFMGERTVHAYRPFAARLGAALDATGDTRLVDLCSGAGAPAVAIAGLLAREGRDVRVTLTDLYPNLGRFRAMAAASGGRVDFVDTPVDATAVPASLRGFRLICNAFHHLDPTMAERLVADAVAKRQGIAVLELLERSPLGVAAALSTGAVMLAVTPFIRPRTLGRFFFTYALPVAPLTTMWDGTVSALRIYSPRELEALVARIPGADAFVWDIGQTGGVPPRVTYLVGRPRVRAVA
jgi:hypothetical protein